MLNAMGRASYVHVVEDAKIERVSCSSWSTEAELI